MPVALPIIDTVEARPSPPGAFVWLVLFVLFMLGGIVYTLLTWTKGEPTNTPLFWAYLLARPALAWLMAFAVRKIVYDRKMQELDAKQEMALEDRAEAIVFGSEPLAVIAVAYQCAMGNGNVATSIAQDNAVLKVKKSRLGGALVRHTSLDFFNDSNAYDRYVALFKQLIDSLGAQLEALPPDIPFDVRLQLSQDDRQEVLLSAWNECWRIAGFRSTQTTLLPDEQGVMALDEWLDVYGGLKLQKLTLFVAVQLHDAPPENSAEAGVALLLCWPLVAERKKVPILAMLHRPLETTLTSLNQDIPTALLWGKAGLEEVNHVWQTGLDKEDKTVFNKANADVKLGAASSDGLSGFHNIDTVLGHAGAAASWLTVALAIEHAQQSQEPQLIACHEGSLRMAVVQPVGNDKKVKAT